MKIEQIYTGCIAQAAYYLESDGEAAIFDPLREVNPYIQKAKNDGAVIKYIFETHFHADFVSGHIDLARKSGGQIVYGPTAKPAFDAIIAEDGQQFKIGQYTITAIHTPGHTLESTCYLLSYQNGKIHGIITGDTLFIGDVGRPDLAQAMSEDLTQQKLASYLYDSLRNKIMTLPDDLIVYPSHGAGSACGKNMSKETTDTLGNQKKTNYALRADMTRDEFISELLNGLGAPPPYFPQNVAMNINGYESLDDVITKSMRSLGADQFEAMANASEAVILDVRHENEFVKAHIPNSIFIGIQGNFAPWVGALLMNVGQPILLLAAEGKEEEAITRLSRVGFDNVLGYLEGGIDAWIEACKATDSIESISPEEFVSVKTDESVVVDARKPGEFEQEHIPGALNFPLDTVNNDFSDIPTNEKFFLHCAGGYRSVIMASILKSRGVHNLVNVEKGISGVRATGFELIKSACASGV
ncbi:MAG TPA: MBL fold metallo-hydrolase [Flavobacterium sp.]|nr:MBL fold metallo-hydrolase [Flavobacterium sp.]